MTHPAFAPVSSDRIESLAISLECYEHRATGARHLHLASQDDNNAFLVALRTVPCDDTGVAHILEHVSLCGSEHYPVRDPFFMMLRRSLNTFMNAFTARDWTAYPFATQNRKDFDNLLRVYLDAVFHPLLDPLDFAQEGHRLEFDSPDDPDSALVIRGVVYNEMKGAMSTPVARVAQRLQAELFPSTTYHFNSGGDPLAIPELGYEQLRAFHARHYHPSNAVFMTYGSFPAEEHQRAFEELVLSRVGERGAPVSIPLERRYAAPVRAEGSFPADDEEGLERKAHVVIGWLLGRSSDVDAMLRAHLLSGVLLDHGASPLRRFLETTDLGAAPSELCGLDDSSREATFSCGLEGTSAEHADAIEAGILDVLQQVARDGVPGEQVEAVLHQVELAQREIGGGRFPYGLRLMTRVLPAVVHEGDPKAVLDVDGALDRLRESIRDPGFVKGLARALLLENPHRVRLVMTPDRAISAREAARLSERLDARKRVMSEDERRRTIEQAAALKARQEREDDEELLPKVGIDDVPLERAVPEGSRIASGAHPVTWFGQGTNGIVYQQLVVAMPALDAELMDLLPLFCDCVVEVGCGERDYLAMQQRQAAVSAGLHARVSVRADVDDAGEASAAFVLAGKALARNDEALAELLDETLHGARFDELDRIRDLVAQLRVAEESSITDRGHALALTAASAGFSRFATLDNRWNGLPGIRQLKALDASLEDPARLAALGERLTRLREAFAAAPRELLLVAEPAEREDMLARLAARSLASGDAAGHVPSRLTGPWSRAAVREAWAVSSGVNFCASAYPAVTEAHADAPALMVLGPFLTDGFLHRVIREQGGAYGGGAGYSADTASLRFFSYRDPRLAGTLGDFVRAAAWLADTDHPPRRLEQAILRVVSELDRPESPAGEAVAAYYGALHGRGAEHRARLRRAVLAVTLDDLRRVGERYLRPGAAATTVLGGEDAAAAAADLGLELKKL
ncbi:MAG: insulinase family protein [Gammaproteobacteria bacterium]|nr:insulinase family protein [Gammaproteobacteria bacterium]